ncbi:VWA domain-containing protein [Actinomadura viridis]|uniref:VWA domain-containing protein n=1 Tax=Actinomadura viridis TaxID=58110 RepID=UPI00369C3C22
MWALIGVAGALVAAVTGVAVAGLPGGCDGRVTLRLAADPAVAPAVTELARRVGDDKGRDGGCVDVIAGTATSPAMATVLGGDRNAGQAQADAYILDSSLWLTVAAQAARRTGAVAPTPVASVAESPVLFAVPKDAVKSSGRLSWRGLAQAPDRSRHAFRITDPRTNASGLISLLMAHQAAGGGEKAAAGFTRILRSAQAGDGAGVAAHSGAALDALRARDGGRIPVVAVPEQALWITSREAAAAVTPADRTLALDFPLVVTRKSKLEAARRMAAVMKSAAGTAELAKIGLRPAGGGAARQVSAVTGVTAPVAMAPPPGPQAVLEALEMWRRMRLGTRMLALIDVSGSMNETVPGTGRTRMAITAGEIGQGMALLPDTAEVGVWTFSTGMNGPLPYRRVTPIGRLGAVDAAGTHRSALQRSLGGLRAKPDGDTGLHDSVLAAFRTVRAGYRADKLNFVLVLTDGRNDFAGGLTERALLETLRKEYDPARPVQVIGLAFGPAVDLAALQRIAAATGGAAYQIRDPRQIRELFKRSAALKICDDPRRCPAG